MIYFIQGEQTKLIKIGRTKTSLLRRLRQLQLYSPDKLHILTATREECSSAERDYHTQFGDARSHGEWFLPTEKLLTFIASLPPIEHINLNESSVPEVKKKERALTRFEREAEEKELMIQGRNAFLAHIERSAWPRVEISQRTTKSSGRWYRLKKAWQSGWDEARMEQIKQRPSAPIVENISV